MNSFWEINSAILKERYPGLLGEISGEPDLSPADYILENTSPGGSSPGGLTLKLHGVYVHSPRDPEREGRRLAEGRLAEGMEGSTPNADNAGDGPVVMLGFGLGYAALAACELWPHSPIIVAEKYRSLLRLAFEKRDLSTLLARSNVAFVLDNESIPGALSYFSGSSGKKTAPAVIRNRALIDLDKEWYGAAENSIRSWTMRGDINTATLKRFGKRWVRNLSCNVNCIRDLPGVNRLSGLAAGFPVFLAAAGPGLDQIASLLPDIAQRCVVIAVDTSLRFLLKHGVSPDFVVVVDPQFWNSRHLDRCVTGNARLVAESAVYPPVLRLPFKEKYLCGSQFPLGSFIEKRVEPKGELGAGGSVATTAWDFARILGAQEIWIAGLDLAFPENKTHFRGALFEEKSLAESSRMNPAEAWHFRTLQGGLPFKAQAANGHVLTDRRLSLYATWFEGRFREFSVIRNYSLSSGGLAIAGLEQAGADSLLSLPNRRSEINHALEASAAQIEKDFFALQEAQRRAERYDKAVLTLLQGLAEIKAAAEDGLKIAEQALKRDYYRLKQDKARQGKIIALLDAVTKSIAESEVKDVAGFLFPPAETEKADPHDGAKTEPFRSYLEASVSLCRSLAESAGYVLGSFAETK